MIHSVKVIAFSKFLDQPGVWICPKCGAEMNDRAAISSPSGLYIDESYCEDDACELAHPDDCVACYSCEWSGQARQVAAAAKRRLGMVKCEHCKGTGMVKKEGT